ncbi:hypothetical protein DSO57_1035971 [Entomophthora muscae]|uniref:Uncharacterized protein n=1 Tax=Entomophthora muscae TaxID=34485 RepID=A0ACC2UK36_9FUNG|nr:hypothetical protein DSO57_1035971 [Entomophthora muscae]
MREFNNLMNKGNLIGTAKKPKKATESQINEAYPIMLDLLQRDPKLPLTQVWKQLEHHGILVSECMVQLWMHRKVASIRVLTNFTSNQCDGAENSPYDTTIKSTLVRCLTSLTDDIMFVSYYKLSIAFVNFGEQGKAATKNGRNKVKKGTFIGAFMTVSTKGFVYYWTNPDFIDGYSYNHILRGLLDSWDGSNSKYRVFLSHQMEGSSTALEAIQECRHQASVYPAGHANIHLADVVFFNIRDTHQECCPQAFNNLYLGVLDHNFLFGHQMVADLFAQMVFHVNMGNQSRKDKRLPPCATATYQSIQPMTDEELSGIFLTTRWLRRIFCVQLIVKSRIKNASSSPLLGKLPRETEARKNKLKIQLLI